SNKTPMSSFGDPSSGGTRASTILANHFGGLRSVSLGVGLSEFSRPASIGIEVSFTSFLRANLLYEDPACKRSHFGNALASGGHTHSERACGGHDRQATGANQSLT